MPACTSSNGQRALAKGARPTTLIFIAWEGSVFVVERAFDLALSWSKRIDTGPCNIYSVEPEGFLFICQGSVGSHDQVAATESGVVAHVEVRAQAHAPLRRVGLAVDQAAEGARPGLGGWGQLSSRVNGPWVVFAFAALRYITAGIGREAVCEAWWKGSSVNTVPQLQTGTN